MDLHALLDHGTVRLFTSEGIRWDVDVDQHLWTAAPSSAQPYVEATLTLAGDEVRVALRGPGGTATDTVLRADLMAPGQPVRTLEQADLRAIVTDAAIDEAGAALDLRSHFLAEGRRTWVSSDEAGNPVIEGPDA